MALKMRGYSLTKQEVEGMFAEFDDDGSEAIDYHEFLRLMKTSLKDTV